MADRSVIQLLFEQGNFRHLLEDIFFRLDPNSLISCSLVCKDWNGFIKKFIINDHLGEIRLRQNWIQKKPNRRQIPIGDNQFDLDRLHNRHGVPKSIAANKDLIVITVHGSIDVFHRETGQLKKNIKLPSQSDQWQVRISSKYVIAYLRQGIHLTLFDLQQNRILPMENIGNVANQLREVWIVNEDFLLIDSQDEMSLVRICGEIRRFQLVWTKWMSFHLMSLHDNILIVSNRYTSSKIFLRTHNVQNGIEDKRQSIYLNHDGLTKVVGLALSKPLAIVMAYQSKPSPSVGGSYKMFLYDMNIGCLMKELHVNYNAPHGSEVWNNRCLNFRIITDSVLETMMISVKSFSWNSRSLLCGKIFAWDLRKLVDHARNGDVLELDCRNKPGLENGYKRRKYPKLEELSSVRDLDFVDYEHERFSPQKIFSMGGMAETEGVVVSRHKLVYPILDEQKKPMIMECDFWGKL